MATTGFWPVKDRLNVHNHFVVNSVSFKTGRKFENHISDHYRLREISDTVCLEHGKSILKDTAFYGGSKKEYKLLCENNIDSPQELVSFIEEKRKQISDSEKERQSIYSRNRHKKSGNLMHKQGNSQPR